MHVTVSKHNYLPYEGEAQVEEQNPQDQDATQNLTNSWPKILSEVKKKSSSAYGLLNSTKSRFMRQDQLILNFASDICMHIAAFDPKYIAPENVDADFLEKERAYYFDEVTKSGKSGDIAQKIVEGKLSKIYSSICLMRQPFVKDSKVTVESVLEALIARLGENIVIKRFARFEIGQ